MHALARLTDPADDALLDAVARRTPADGHHLTPLLGLQTYRFSAPTTFLKRPCLGVTMGTVLQGTKRVVVEDVDVELRPGDVLLFTRDATQDATVRPAGPHAPYYGLSMKFCPERVARGLLRLVEAGAPAEGEAAPALRAARDPRITEALLRLLHYVDDPVDREILAPLVVDEILLLLLRSDAAAALRAGVGHAEDADRILSAMAYIREHAVGGVSVAQVARHVAMSPSHFAHRFTAVARLSPMKYARQVRLEEARTLVLSGHLRMTEIADRTGYQSAAHFTRDFTRQYGVAPSRYRDRIR